jgi:hypothetical protein
MFKKLLFTCAVAAFSGAVATPALACGGSCGKGGAAAAVAAPTTTARGTTTTRRFSYDPAMSGGSYRAPMYRGSMGRGRGQFGGVRPADSKVRGQY